MIQIRRGGTRSLQVCKPKLGVCKAALRLYRSSFSGAGAFMCCLLTFLRGGQGFSAFSCSLLESGPCCHPSLINVVLSNH